MTDDYNMNKEVRPEVSSEHEEAPEQRIAGLQTELTRVKRSLAELREDRARNWNSELGAIRELKNELTAAHNTLMTMMGGALAKRRNAFRAVVRTFAWTLLGLSGGLLMFQLIKMLADGFWTEKCPASYDSNDGYGYSDGYNNGYDCESTAGSWLEALGGIALILFVLALVVTFLVQFGKSCREWTKMPTELPIDRLLRHHSYRMHWDVVFFALLGLVVSGVVNLGFASM
jgi:hypothetical protein